MRTTPAKRRFAGLVLGIGVLLAFAIRPASGSCAGPSVVFEGKGERKVITGHLGDTVSLVGEFWTTDCFDTGPTGACEHGPGDERPLQGIDVDLLQGQEAVIRVVEDVDAEPDLTLSVSFQVPDVSPGGYRILVHDGGIEAQAYPELWLRIREAPGPPTGGGPGSTESSGLVRGTVAVTSPGSGSPANEWPRIAHVTT